MTATGFVEPASGLSGVIDFSGTLNSDGRQMTSKGTATAAKMRLVPGSQAAGQPVKIAYETTYEMAPQSGTLKQGDVTVGKATAHLTGTFKTAGDVTSLDMKLVGSAMPAADLESVLPALNVTLPMGASLKEGAINVNMTITGPTDKLVIAGPVNLSNAKVTGFDLGSKMKALSTFAGIPNMSDTVIQTLSSDVRVAPDGTHADNFNLVIPSIGNMTGAGTIDPKQNLDFKMVARLTNVASPLGALTSIAGLGGGQQGKGGGIPFRIQGTTSDPKFIPDLAGLAGGFAGGAASGGKSAGSAGENLGKALGGLFGGKKKQ